MCGIAGILDLRGRQEPDRAALTRMTEAILHRGPDEDGYFFAPGIGIGHRRLSIVGLGDGRQPISNEDGSVVVMYNGELFDYPEQKAALEAKGHVFKTHSDTELLVHFYEEYGEGMFEHLHGQFAFAIVDKKKKIILLARDKVGICPLHWSKQGDTFYFGSEIKAILASGHVKAACDVRGLDHIFTYFAMGTRRTMFEGISSVLPGHYLKIQFRDDGDPADVVERRYWDLDFPDAGEEYDPEDPTKLIDEFDATFQRAVEVRLRADVPVVSYLSGGIDSAMVISNVAKIRGKGIPAFTIRIVNPHLDETQKARDCAKHVGSDMTVVHVDGKVIAEAYPKLVAAADCPVVDTSCASLWCLAREVHNQGYKVALTGEGSDEAMAGYVWFKTNKILRLLDFAGFKPSVAASRAFRKITNPSVSFSEMSRIDNMIGGPHAQAEMFNFVSKSRSKFYSQEMKERLGTHLAFEDMPFDLERMRRWSPLNQSLYIGYKTMLCGLLLNHKGDRVAMANSVETRYPFLDDNVIKLCSKVHPRWKLRRLRMDKYLLRQTATRYLPREIALRPKAMFRAPFADSFFGSAPDFAHQLMSEESLRKTGYFDVEEVRKQFLAYSSGRASRNKFFNEMGMISVLSTQMWHHMYCGGGLCDLPTHDPTPKVDRIAVTAGA